MLALAKFIFDNPLGKAVAAGLGILALLSAYTLQQRSIGATKATEKVQANNAKLNKAASLASDKSLDPAARGVLNPYYRRD